MSTLANPAARMRLSRSRSHEHPSKVQAHGRRSARCSGAGGGAGRGGDVLDEAVGAAGAQDAADLGEDVGGVGHRAEHEGGDHAVDAVVGQVGALGDTVVEVEVHASALGGDPQPSVHVRVGFDGDERGPGGQVAEVGTHSGAELDDLLGQLAEEAPLVLAEVPLEVRAHQG